MKKPGHREVAGTKPPRGDSTVREPRVSMKRHFVRTENLARLEAGIASLAVRGAREASWLLVTGRPGEGKTTTLYHWGAAEGAVYLTAVQGMTPGRLIAALAERMGIPQGRTMETAIGARLVASQSAIILDESGFALDDRAACLERLRGITDKSGTPVILIAMPQDVWRFGQHQQISSRIFNWVEFAPASAADVAAVCQQLADVQIEPDLVQRIHAETEGRMRSVLNAIARIEGVARAASKTRMASADMRGALCEDYRRGRQVLSRVSRKGGEL